MVSTRTPEDATASAGGSVRALAASGAASARRRVDGAARSDAPDRRHRRYPSVEPEHSAAAGAVIDAEPLHPPVKGHAAAPEDRRAEGLVAGGPGTAAEGRCA